jgi:inhibitor of cysteine peptidase
MMTVRSFIAVLLVVVILAGALVLGTGLIDPENGNGTEVKRFNSTAELKAFLLENRAEAAGSGGGVASWNGIGPQPQSGTGISKTLAREDSAQGTMAPPLAFDGSATEYSTTNLQVRGVDEADFVKNDGKYIYLISGEKLVIVDAYPAEKADILSETNLSGQPVELFLSGNRLVVFSSGQDETLVKPEKSLAPVPYWRQMTHASVYDISDRSDPELVRTISLSGSYLDSRMIGDYVYTVTTEPVPWYGPDPVFPMVKDDSTVTIPPVYYFDMPYGSFVYNTISSFSVKSDSTIDAETFLSGYSTTLYVSTDNLYIAYQKQIPYQRWETIRPLGAEPVVGADIPQEGTIIHRFAIQNGDVSYAATGDVPGHLLNQFSMDEDSRNLRVATTVQGWNSRGSYQFNNVYVLDSGMETIGKLEYIAPDERIYSTRFVGDRLYMVTFKRIDPFFVIDLSDPEHPGILGELKIPGYSDYLHPYDENYIIGVGKETGSSDWGGVSVAGLKLALFDVTDVNNPRLVDKVEIGDAGTDSEALRDHKAFLFDKGKDLLVIPVSEVTMVPLKEYPGSPYTHGFWQGAYVFSVTPESGFVLKGKVTHAVEENSIYSWGSDETVRRSLYMDDVLCTISSQSIIMSDLSDPVTRLNRVALPITGYYGGYPYRME